MEMVRLKLGVWEVNVNFLPPELRAFQDKTADTILDVWRKTIIPVSHSSPDFTVTFLPPGLMTEVIRKSNDDYYNIVHWAPRTRNVSISHILNVNGFNFVLRNVLFRLTDKRSFIFHGSSVVDRKGTVSLFTADSGGGKSTTLKTILRHTDFTPLTDDLILFARRDKTFDFLTTGLMEKNILPINERHPHYRIFNVIKSTNFAIVPITRPHDKLKVILRQVWHEAKESDLQTGKLLLDFADMVPVYNLFMPLHYESLGEKILETV
jgi:hypothetical protein